MNEGFVVTIGRLVALGATFGPETSEVLFISEGHTMGYKVFKVIVQLLVPF
jgi:hypothetical protein